MTLEETEHGRKGSVFCKFANEEIDVAVYDEGVSEDYIEKCIMSLNNLSDKTTEEICNAAKKYCLKVKELYEEYDLSLIPIIPITADTKAEEICKYFKITGIVIEKPEDEKIVGYSIGGNCDWETEHGIEIIIRDEKVVYLGADEANSPWNDYDIYDEWNFINHY